MYPPDDSKVDSVQDELLTFNLIIEIVNISYNNLRAIHRNFVSCVFNGQLIRLMISTMHPHIILFLQIHTHTCHSNYMTIFGVHEMHVLKLMLCKLLLVGSWPRFITYPPPSRSDRDKSPIRLLGKIHTYTHTHTHTHTNTHTHCQHLGSSFSITFASSILIHALQCQCITIMIVQCLFELSLAEM